MSRRIKWFAWLLVLTMAACRNGKYLTNGETIYRTGKNLKGEVLLDKENSELKFIKSCQTCHGRNGTFNKKSSVKFSHLSDPAILDVPYTEATFFRFLDEDLKSDGSPVRTGVKWKMSQEDKKDLLEFLKVL